MWSQPKVLTRTNEPVTVDEIKRQCSVLYDDDDALLESLIAAARDHVEKYCGTLLATQTVEAHCDGFFDLSRLPFAPVQSVTSVVYVDTAGDEQTLPDTVYEGRLDGFGAAIVTKYGQRWPGIQLGSRIKVTATAGYVDVPAAVKHAMLLWISAAYEQRENAEHPAWTAFDVLLANYRR